jgi:hypothetical protein
MSHILPSFGNQDGNVGLSSVCEKEEEPTENSSETNSIYSKLQKRMLENPPNEHQEEFSKFKVHHRN